MQLGLGTANFAMQYGVTNDSQMSQDETQVILNEALSSGIRFIDTAQLYGNAESVLGQYQNLKQFDVISKLGEVIDEAPEQVITSVQNSLHNLGIERLYGLLLHRPESLLKSTGEDNFKKLQAAKDLGLVNKIGVSVYQPSELQHIIKNFKIDLVQVPLNVFDQRFYQSGLLERAKDKNIEIHARSLYLQGTLLTEVEELPPYFQTYQSTFQQLAQLIDKYQITRLEAALSFVKSLNLVDVAIIGCNNVEQLIQTVQMCRQLPPDIIEDLTQLSCSDEGLILPTQWRLN